MEQVLASYSPMGCADWHDRVYGLLTLVRNGDHFPVDYSIEKIALVMAVLRFEGHENWPLTLTIAHFLTTLLGIADVELLHYRSNNKEVGERPQWKTIPIRVRGVVDRPSKIKPGQWILSNRGIFRDNDSNVTVDTCRCPRCASRPLPPFLPGDEIYELESFIDNPGTNNHTYLAFRPNASNVSGYEYLGALSSRGFSTDFLLHSLPQLASQYDMQTHVRINVADETFLLLEVDPSTLCFLIRALIVKNCDTPLPLPTEKQKVYAWDHDLTFHFGMSSQQTFTGPLSIAELISLVNSVSRSVQHGVRR